MSLDLSRPSPRVQATPSFAEREEWIRALNEAACEVSKLFRDSAGRAERKKARDAAKARRQACRKSARDATQLSRSVEEESVEEQVDARF